MEPVADESAWYLPSAQGLHWPSSLSLSARENDTLRTVRPSQFRTSTPSAPHRGTCIWMHISAHSTTARSLPPVIFNVSPLPLCS